MKRHILFASVLLASISAFAQNGNVTGVVVDKLGNPVSGALVEILNNKLIKAYTDKDGAFEIGANANDKLIIAAPDQSKKTVALNGSKEIKVVMDYASRPVEIGFGIKQNVEESTVSVASASNDEFNKRSSKNIGNSLLSGSVLGLTALQGAGDYASYEPSFYVRGLQGLNGSSPLILIDGIERNITYLSPEEVENVYVLKDAAATALYGYKGANGVVNIVTKRGKYKTNEIKFTYDHAFNWEARRPKFVNAYDYALGLNEAYVSDGKSPRYTEEELGYFKDGSNPYLYPNVDWIGETFKNNGSSDIYNLAFRGGGERLRYYTNVNLISNLGFIAHPKENSGYSTQNKYSKGSIRTNLDIDLTSTTKLQTNLNGVLMEASRPGLSSDDLWGKIYTVPAAAFPIKTENGLWGGNATWTGYYNPVALTEGRAYSKAHTRSLFADMTLSQDLSAVTDGLSVWTRIAYDNIAAYWENHTKEYKYGMGNYVGGKDGEMSGDSKLDWQNKNFNFGVGANYDHTFGNHSISSVLMWNYEYRNWNGQNNTQYRTTATLYNHYGYKERYLADVSLSLASSNKLAPGHRTNFSPTVSAAWVLSKENFMQNVSFIDFLKLRASWGRNGNVNILSGYPYSSPIALNQSFYQYNPSIGDGKLAYGSKPTGLANPDLTWETSEQVDLGLDARFLNDRLTLGVDWYRKTTKDLLIQITPLPEIGVNKSVVNTGKVLNSGLDFELGWRDNIKDFKYSVTVNGSTLKNEVKEVSNLISRLTEIGIDGFNNQLKPTFEAGHQVWYFRGYKYAGVAEDGSALYYNKNGETTSAPTDEDKQDLGSAIPKFTYGITLNAEYKGFDLTVFGTGAAGNKIYNLMVSADRPLINGIDTYWKDSWRADRTNAKYPDMKKVATDWKFFSSDAAVFSGSYFKIKQIQLGYTLPKTITSVAGISNLRVYCSLDDFFTITKYPGADPETASMNSGASRGFDNGTYPTSKKVVFGINVTF